MSKNLGAKQEAMRARMAAPPKPVIYSVPRGTYVPVDYSKPVEYSTEVTALFYLPEVNGVYLLTEGGRFYIGQSIDVLARFSGHRLRPICCKFKDPRGAILASVPFRDGASWAENARVRLNAEARFIAAALSLDLPLTNTLSEYKRGKLRGLFPDVTRERERLVKAVKLCANLC